MTNYKMTYNSYLNDSLTCEHGDTWALTFKDSAQVTYNRKGFFLKKFESMYKLNLPQKIEMYNSRNKQLVMRFELK